MLHDGSSQPDFEEDLGEHKPHTEEIEEELLSGKKPDLIDDILSLRNATPFTIALCLSKAETTLKRLREENPPSRVDREALEDRMSFSYADFRKIIITSKHFKPALEDPFYRRHFEQRMTDTLQRLYLYSQLEFHAVWGQFFDATKNVLDQGGPIATFRYVRAVTAHWDSCIVGKRRHKIQFSRLLDHKELEDALQQNEGLRQLYTSLGRLPSQDDVWSIYDVVSPILVDAEHEQVAGLLGQLSAVPDFQMLSRLVRKCNPEESLDLLVVAAQEPRIISVVQLASKAGVQKSALYPLITSSYRAHVGSSSDGLSLIDVLHGLGEKNRLNVLARLVSAADQFLSSRYQSALLPLITTHPEADVLLKEALEYEQRGDHEKVRLLLYLGNDPSLRGQEFATLRKHLRQLTDADLAGYTPHNPARLLRDKKPTGQEDHTSRSTPATEPRIWIDHLISQIPHLGDDLQTVYAACHEYGVEHRLRYLLREHIQTATGILADLKRLHAKGHLDTMLKDSEFFAAYKRSIVQGSHEELVDHVCAIDANGKTLNSYVTLRSLVLNEPEEAYAPAAAEPKEKEAQPDQAASGLRVFICAGKFPEHKRSRIEESAPGTYLRFYDIDDLNRGSRPMLRSGDVVLWAATVCNHPVYFAMKQYCRKNDVEFRHANTSGIAAMQLALMEVQKELG